ncbi:MAG: biotin/lipoyl-binding protein, partial [Reyranella sp.]|nr:biotin/lipoyl-binding protein [Reyranella sp.]
MRDGEHLDTQTPPIAAAVLRRPRFGVRMFARAFMWALPAIVLAITLFIWLSSGGSVTTDNAYVKGDRAQIATQLSGVIVEVPVQENERVSRGQLLFRLD